MDDGAVGRGAAEDGVEAVVTAELVVTDPCSTMEAVACPVGAGAIETDDAVVPAADTSRLSALVSSSLRAMVKPTAAAMRTVSTPNRGPRGMVTR